MIKGDKEILWRPGRIYIPAWQFTGLDYEATTATDIKSIGTGAANDTGLVEINTSGITGLSMGANANSVETLLQIPDWDKAFNIYFRVWWTANNTSGTCTWDVLYKKFVADTTVLGSAVSATALTTAIGADTMAGVAYTLMRSPEGVLAGGTLDDNVEVIQLGVVRTGVTTITTPYFVGLDIRYTPKRLQGQGSLIPAKPALYIGSNKY